MLYLIGIGLSDEKDISVKGLEIVKKTNKIYLENYTSKVACSKEDLEKFYGKEIIEIDRDFVEKNIESIFEAAKSEDIVFLVMGDVHSATTHIDLFLRAKKEKVPIKTIFGTSILTAVGITGLSLYNFGRTVSIPFDNKDVKSSYEKFKVNKENGMHTLFLLDLNPVENKFMSIKEGLEYLKKNGLNDNELVIGCARIGSYDQVIKSGKVKDVMEFDFGESPYCLIIPGKLHFMEEEMLNTFKH